MVGDVLKDGLDTTPQPEHLSHAQQDGPQNIQLARKINVVIRTATDPNAFAPQLRSVVRDIEPAAALGHVGALSSQVASCGERSRDSSTAVLAAFALLALGIAITGLYGVLLRNAVAAPTEIGIRAALGATRRDLNRVGRASGDDGHGCWSRGRGARRRFCRATTPTAALRNHAARFALVPCHAGNPAGGGGARLRCSRAARRRNRSVDDAAG